MTQAKITYGLMISTAIEYGSRRVTAQLMRREHGGDNQDRPLGISSDDQYRAYRDEEPKNLVGLQMDGLGMYGFVAEDFAKDPSGICFIGSGVEYRSVFSIDLETATRMMRTLKLIVKRFHADSASEPGDYFTSLCAALKLSWVCERVDRNSNWRSSEWRFMSVADGRNRYRQLIAEAIAAAVAAKFPNSVAA